MKRPANFLIDLPREVLIGMAQIMLQPSPLVGAAFLVGAFFNSAMLALFGVAGCLAGVLMALICKYPDDERYDGLYGFNGGLVGLGVGYFYDAYLPLLIPVVFGGMVTSVVMHKMMRRGIRPFTFPFVAVTWIIMLILSATGWAAPSPWPEPEANTIRILESISRGYGQVLFQEQILTGLIFVAVIAIKSWIQGLYATLATVTGLICGYALDFPVDAINLGLFGYNGVLCGVLFAGRTGKDFISAMAAIFFSVALVRLFHIIEIQPFTFPFVLSSWLVLWGRRSIWLHQQL